MEWVRLLFVLAVFFAVVAFIQFYKLRNVMKTLNLGDRLSVELATRLRKKRIIASVYLAVGVLLGMIGVYFAYL